MSLMNKRSSIFTNYRKTFVKCSQEMPSEKVFLNFKLKFTKGQNFPTIKWVVVKKSRSKIGETPFTESKDGPKKMKPPVLARVTQSELLPAIEASPEGRL